MAPSSLGVGPAGAGAFAGFVVSFSNAASQSSTATHSSSRRGISWIIVSFRRQRMIFPEKHALAPKAYKKCEPIFSGKMQKVSNDVPSYPDPQ